MTWMILFLVVGTLWLAYANGANDNFKGVATLFGTRTASYRSALTWATCCTLLGSVASVFLAKELVGIFSGKGIVADIVISQSGFPVAFGLGAAATVMLATRLGLPVSTTHALTGALVGAGLVAPGADLNFVALGRKFALPLLMSPFLALGITVVLYAVLHRVRKKMGVTRETCLCVGEEVRVVGGETGRPEVAMALRAAQPSVSVGTATECFQRYTGTMAGVNAQGVLDRGHYLSAGAVSFARGLNDTPKIAALLLVAPALPTPVGLVLVGVAIALGGILSARRVAETMSHKITDMNHGQGFTANLVTSLLVIFASRWGMPVSTTHVSCGSLFGIGLVSGRARWRAILGILAAWIITLPMAALVAAVVFLVAGL